MHLRYSQQLEAKRQRVIDALERVGKIPNAKVEPSVSSPQPLYYRNKIQLPVGKNGRLGLYAHRSHEVVEIDRCYIHCDLGEKVFQYIQHLLQNYPHWKELKYVLLKTAVYTQQVLVVIIVDQGDIPSAFIQQLMQAMPEVKGVVKNVNPSKGNFVFGPDFQTMAGQGWIEEKLSYDEPDLQELSFKISPTSFFQVNPAQAKQLYQKVIALAALTGKETVMDAYCGVGTLSLTLAQKAKEVIGIESVAAAVEDANENARRNGMANVRFCAGAAEDLITTLPHVDVAILNPPRKGCERVFLEKLLQLSPKRIIYVSCDPATLARDLRILMNGGYTIGTVVPFDMFPQTSHIETVVQLDK